jgi:polysaccharide pyruvyl transferase WcaK-like protein
VKKSRIVPQATSAKRIGLLGPYGFGNLGDASIQEAVIHNIKRYLPNAEIFGFSLAPQDTENRHNIKSYPIVRMAHVTNDDESEVSLRQPTFMNKFRRMLTSPVLNNRITYRLWTIWKEINFILNSYKNLRTIDILIMSGGGQLDDYWGGVWGHPYTLFKWAILAKLSKTRLIFMSVGVDSIRFRLSRFFIKSSLLLSSYRSYREHNSLMVVEALGVKPGGRVYPDLAFSLPVIRDPIKNNAGSDTRPLIGVSPIAAMAWTKIDDPVYQNYFNQLVSLVLWLVQNNYRVLFFPTQIKVDTPLIAELKERLINRGIIEFRKNEIIENRVLTVDDLIEQISKVDMIVASRLHGVILSLLMYKPVLAISYLKKVDLTMSDMGLSEYCLDVNQIDLPSLIMKFQLLESNAEAITIQIKDKVSSYTKALDDQYGYLFANRQPGEDHPR